MYCTCGKCMQLTERNRQLNKARYDGLSTPGYVLKNNPSHGARHRPSVRQTMNYEAHDMLRKARKHRSGGCKSILEIWHVDDKYRKSLSDIEWAEEQIVQNDELALEFQRGYMARKKSERKIMEHFFGPLNQRSDFIEAKRECK